MATDPNQQRRSPIGAVTLFVFACFCYCIMMGWISYWVCCAPDIDFGQLFQSTFQNNGVNFNDLFAKIDLFFTFALWVALGVLLLIGALYGEMPGRVRKLAPVAFPLSCAASFAGIDLYWHYHGWAIVAPMLLPPLIGLYAMWARLPQLHRMLPAKLTSAVAWGAILALTVAPFPLSYVDARAYPDRRLDVLANYRAPNARYEQREEGIRRLKSRQATAVLALEKASLDELPDLWQFGLEATPALCKAFSDALRKDAGEIHGPWGRSAQRDVYMGINVANHFYYQLSNIKWLVSARCDLGDALAGVDTTVRAFPQSPLRDRFLADLAQVRQPH